MNTLINILVLIIQFIDLNFCSSSLTLAATEQKLWSPYCFMSTPKQILVQSSNYDDHN